MVLATSTDITMQKQAEQKSGKARNISGTYQASAAGLGYRRGRQAGIRI
jgi:hypothetical protein